MTANLFDDKKAIVNGKLRTIRTSRKGATLQAKLIQYIRAHGSITESEYREKIGGKSVSAALHNLRLCGMLVQGAEFIDSNREYNTDGSCEMRYHLRTIKPAEPVKAAEVAPEAPPEPETAPELPEPVAPEAVENFIQLVSVDLIGGDCYLRVVMGDGSVLTRLLTHMERRFIRAGLSAFD